MLCLKMSTYTKYLILRDNDPLLLHVLIQKSHSGNFLSKKSISINYNYPKSPTLEILFL